MSTTGHDWMQIGTVDAEGFRTFTTPGEVCVQCSDEAAGRWVPVSQCASAMTAWQKDHEQEQS